MNRRLLCCPRRTLGLLLIAGMLISGCAPDDANTTADTDNARTPDATAGDTNGELATDPELALVSAGCNASQAHMAARMLDVTNAARRETRMCGNERFVAAPALRWDTRLEQAARAHSADMARHDFFDHTGSDGLAVADRVDATGFAWRALGENIAAGQNSAQETTDAWLQSPGHCRNLMNPEYTHFAVACEVAENSTYKRYWTQVFAQPGR